ncbi:MAG: class I SAM-dependent methyltransferase [Chitinophagaceae bacterium]|jgi:SAM-dependent methyltransferase
MEKISWFESWFNSPYYKVLYQNRDVTEAEDFTEALLGYLKPAPGSRIVDIGCGEGRFAVQFANNGYDVTGIDLAENRIEKALELECENLHFFVHDMRLPFYINYFDFAFNLFTSFGYFASARDNQLAANSFAGGLKKGGTLVVDYLNSDWVLQQLKPYEIVERDGIKFDIQKDYDGRHIIKHIRFTDAEGVARHYTERVSAFSLQDFITLFSNAGLKLETTFGDYTLAPFVSKTSPRLIMVFKK